MSAGASPDTMLPLLVQLQDARGACGVDSLLLGVSEIGLADRFHSVAVIRRRCGLGLA
jgi:hypothetical protein